jgi:hypothetical protein
MANVKFRQTINAQPEIVKEKIVKETALFAGDVVDLLPESTPGVWGIVTKISVWIQIARLVIEFINKIKYLINEQRAN